MKTARLDPQATPPSGPAAPGGWLRNLPRDKADTLLLLAAAVMVLAPHAGHLPAWVSFTCALTLGWRSLITLRGTRLPPSIILLPLTLMAMGGIYITYKTLLGREAGVAMAVLLVAFKMLEMHARRDLFVVIFLCFFLVLTNFFYSQSIGTGAMMVASIIALLTAQLSFQYTGVVPSLGKRLLLGAKILGVAAPAALLLFLLFPRIQGPLWGMPNDAGGARTGMSNTMAPGNLSSLAQSQEIAFRAKFDGRPPDQTQLYWRGLVLGDFDGRTWTQRQATPGNGRLAVRGKPVAYQVTLEPHNERWLFALDMPNVLPQMEHNSARLTGEFELRSGMRVSRRERYGITSYLDYQLDPGGLQDSERWLALPRGFNPRAMQAGLDLQREADPAERVRKVLSMFRRDGFSYTLEPPLLGLHTVDEFLYTTKAGFCEHFSSAFVVLMRAADVPARVVTGYQGGELNPVDGFMMVRQSDAHAWAEVWLPGRGWVRVDPTAAVAPERVQRNLARALPESGSGLAAIGSLIQMSLDGDSWLGQLRYRMSALNNGWNQWVLNYDPERRRGMLDTLTQSMSNWRVLAVLALGALLLYAVRLRRLRRETDPVDALYSVLCQRLGRLGLERAPDEGPTAYAQRVAAAGLAPDKTEALVRFLQLYSSYKYGAQQSDPALPTTLKKLLAAAQ